MAVKTEPILTGEFILSLASGQRSKAQITVKSGEDLKAGDVLAKETTAAGTASGAADAGVGVASFVAPGRFGAALCAGI